MPIRVVVVVVDAADELQAPTLPPSPPWPPRPRSTVPLSVPPLSVPWPTLPSVLPGPFPDRRYIAARRPPDRRRQLDAQGEGRFRTSDPARCPCPGDTGGAGWPIGGAPCDIGGRDGRVRSTDGGRTERRCSAGRRLWSPWRCSPSCRRRPGSVRRHRLTPSSQLGYRLVRGDGGIFAYGAPFTGPAAADPTTCPPNATARSMPFGTCLSMATMPTDQGYWVLNAYTGAVTPYGDAVSFGDRTASNTGAADLWPTSVAITPTWTARATGS